MTSSKLNIIFLNTVLFISLSATAHECVSYFKVSDFAQSYQISTQQFWLLENLARLEISVFGIESAVLKSATLEDVSTKLSQILQAGVPIQVYQKIKEFVLEDMKDMKQLEEARLREQEQRLNESRIDGTRAIFHRIEPGTFQMGEVGDQAPTIISKAFELMATQTTQIIWKKIAELAHSKLPGKYEIKVDPSVFKGDTRPVEAVSAYEVEAWIKALNELSELGEPTLTALIQGHKKGDVYALPTGAQWEFVIRGRGQYNDVYHFGDKEAELEDYAWFLKNSGRETHPVAQKQPLIVGGKYFFDMHGNVSEWMVDLWDKSSPIQGGVDPIGIVGEWRVLRGRSWFSNEQELRSADHSISRPEHRHSDVGFRLLRILD